MERAHSASRDSGSVASVVKALRLLEYVGDNGPCSLAEISTGMRMPKSTLFRLLATLCSEGFLERRGAGEYAVSVKLWRLGATAVDFAARHEAIVDALRKLV